MGLTRLGISIAILNWVILLTMLSVASNDRLIELETVGGIKIGRGNRITQRKATLVPLYSSQVQHNSTYDRTVVPSM
jgi:hypothetical protein